MQKSRRHNEILKLIAVQSIGSQEELTDLLKKRDVFVNQSSVSRDLSEIGVVKINGSYALPAIRSSVVFGLLSVETAGDSLIVAKCESGLASAVAVRIDSAQIVEIIGTVAGDDTIFIAVKDKSDRKIVVKKVWKIFEK